MGVGPLAIYLAQLGFVVSGEDDSLTTPMRGQLERGGVTLTGSGEIAAGAALLVISSAIPVAHPAMKRAQATRMKIARRGEVLAEVTRETRFVAICGSHGKTTTTAMLITALRQAQFPAGYILGGLFNEESWPPARVGSNGWVVAEVDESDGTIRHFAPTLTVTVNLDWDHPDHYRQLADLERTFRELFERTRQAVVVSDACALSAKLAQGGAGLPLVRTFGRSGDFAAEIRAETPEGTKLELRGEFELGTATVRAHGEFNAANANAALAAAQLMGVPLRSDLLASYPGVRRRQTLLRSAGAFSVIEDYAHHPAEIRALLSSLRRQAGEAGRRLVIFQPHRFSRTAQFKAEFAASLSSADRLYLLDVYGAGEAPLPGGTTADLYAEIKRIAPALPVFYLPGDREGTCRALLDAVSEETMQTTRDRETPAAGSRTVVAFVGAGDIDAFAREWLAALERTEAGARVWDEKRERLRGLLIAGTKVTREEPLAEKTTMRVGGAARLYVEPTTIDDLRTTVQFARREEIQLHLLGRGSNLLIPDHGVDGLVVSLHHEAWHTFEPRAEGRVWVGAGLRLKNLCGLAAKVGLSGFEFLEGIPGNVGGALRMNAGAMGGWMFDVVEQVQLMTRDGDVRLLKKEEMHVDYRHCAELQDAVALGALLRPAAQQPSTQIKQQIDQYREKRHKTQPREPSAGCIFKNPAGDSAGRLIDVSGLKGERVGDAEVSTVHANFIVNRGQATSEDVIELVRRVRARVREKTGINLEPEVLLYGQEWKDVL